MALSFSDGSTGSCDIENESFSATVEIPRTPMVRCSDDNLRIRCKTTDGREATASVPSAIGSKIVASAVFLDFRITDSITDKHLEYPASFVIPVKPKKIKKNAMKKLERNSPAEEKALKARWRLTRTIRKRHRQNCLCPSSPPACACYRT